MCADFAGCGSCVESCQLCVCDMAAHRRWHRGRPSRQQQKWQGQVEELPQPWLLALFAARWWEQGASSTQGVGMCVCCVGALEVRSCAEIKREYCRS